METVEVCFDVYEDIVVSADEDSPSNFIGEEIEIKADNSSEDDKHDNIISMKERHTNTSMIDNSGSQLLQIPIF